MGFSLVVVSRSYFSFQCSGISLLWLLSLRRVGFRVHELQSLQDVGSTVVAPRF